MISGRALIAVREPGKLSLAGFARGSLLRVRHRITSVDKGLDKRARYRPVMQPAQRLLPVGDVVNASGRRWFCPVTLY